MSKGEREQTNEAYKHGRIAQLVEYLPYKEGVTGSSPVSPTTPYAVKRSLILARAFKSQG